MNKDIYTDQDAKMIYNLSRDSSQATVENVNRLLALAVSRECSRGVRPPTEHRCSECAVVFYTFGIASRVTCGKPDCKESLHKKNVRNAHKKKTKKYIERHAGNIWKSQNGEKC